MQNINARAVLSRTFRNSKLKFALVVVVVASLLGNMPPMGSMAFADPKADCSEVGGAFVTNFIASDQTAGTATGDLKGALGVKVLAVLSGTIGAGTPVKLKVQHFWVTETGDTLLLNQAELTAYPGASPSQTLLYSFVYEQGVKLVGGTGKYDGATGTIKAWGAVDLSAGEVVGRYAGQVCLKASSKP